MLPAHIATALDIGENVDAPAAAASLQHYVETSDPWFLNVDDGCAEVVGMLGTGATYSIEIVEIENPQRAWKYAALSNGSWSCWVICVPLDGAGNATTDLSSDGLRALARLWWTIPDLTEIGQPHSIIPTRFHGRAIIIANSGTKSHERELSLLLAGAVRKSLTPSAALNWLSASSFVTTPAALALSEMAMAPQLLRGVLVEALPKWRFLNLYRIFESAYLISVRAALDSDFLTDPKRAVETAGKALNSELETFCSLVTRERLEPQFVAIRTAIIADTANRYLHAIKHRNSAQAEWRQGVNFIYQVRCSIVHAGQQAPVYERYPDADAALAILSPLLEEATFRLLGITF